ncbi:MAG: hypothetical protein ACKOPS_23135, partial [Cyanobium sp.]
GAHLHGGDQGTGLGGLGELALQPPPRLRLIDVDSDPDLQQRFGLEVPLLAQNLPADERLLPRVPPRLAGEQLLRWLKQQGVQLE